MFKKFYVAIFFAVILSLLVGSVAFAQTSQEEPGLRGGRRGIGQITSLGDGQLTIISRQGTEYIIYVDENTRFRSREGEIEGLEDLQPGMVVVVITKKDDGGGLVALGVAAATRDQLPCLDLRAAGKVVEVEVEGFSLLARDGEQYTLLVTEKTRFRSRGGCVQGLDDLKPGMPVAVGAVQLADGSYEARLLLVGPLRRP